MIEDLSRKNAVIALSGAFDPLHIGHIRMCQGARHFGKVVIILNSDRWVFERKGYVLMPFEQRRELLLALRDVDEVVGVDDSDGTVVEALKRIMPTVFGNGGIRTKGNTPERQFCLEHGIKLVYGIGGGEREHISLNIEEKIRNVSKQECLS